MSDCEGSEFAMELAYEFVGEGIAVQTSNDDAMPVSFVWRKREYKVDRVLKAWQDWSFPLGRAPRRQAWRARRHRNCYLLLSDGRIFEVYRDRGANEAWVLLKVAEKGAAGESSSLLETGS